jgi:hypothetical protein
VLWRFSTLLVPIMGFLSEAVGLTVAMHGSAILALACAGALVMVGRLPSDAAPAGKSTSRDAIAG